VKLNTSDSTLNTRAASASLPLLSLKFLSQSRSLRWLHQFLCQLLSTHCCRGESAAKYDLLNADIRAVRMQLLLEPNLEDAEDGDEYETVHSGEASWEAQVVPTNVVDLFQVELSMRFSEPPEGLVADYTETLYLLRPTWSESDERSDLLQDKREALEDTRRDFNF
jgi:hypothetical protein